MRSRHLFVRRSASGCTDGANVRKFGGSSHRRWAPKTSGLTREGKSALKKFTRSLFLATLVANVAASAATFEDAQIHASKGNYRAAAEILQPLVQEGNARAQGLMGLLLIHGQGVTKHVDEGLRLLTVSADSGNAGAQGVLSIAYMYGNPLPRDPHMARVRAEQASIQGNALGQAVLGTLRLATGKDEELAAAAELFKKSAEQRFPLGEYQLGKLTALGWVVARDRQAGLAMMQKAATTEPALRPMVELATWFEPYFDDFRTGRQPALCDTMICHGRWGANKREAKSFYMTEMWFELAAIALKSGADIDLVYYYIGRAAEGMNFELVAISNYNAAANSRKRCAGILNNCDGLDVPALARAKLEALNAKILTRRAEESARNTRIDRERAEQEAQAITDRQLEAELTLLQQILGLAGSGDPAAQRALAERYFAGKGVTRDVAMALAWLTRAATAGDTEAQLNLGERLLKGRDVPRDVLQSEKWLKQARDRGSAQAGELLQALAEERRQRTQEQAAERAARERRAAEAQALRQSQEQAKRSEEERKRQVESAAKVKSL